MQPIPCPYCGARPEDEFHYRGDASVKRPKPDAGEQAFYDYVYTRSNPRGWHAEWGQHFAGCRQWMKVERNTLTHEVRAAVGPAETLPRRTGMSGYRLPEGGFIDRSRRLAFRFDGKVLEGHPGDTLACALIANGVTLVGRSFKYQRPRGIMTAGPEEPNALVELGEGGRAEPNAKATEIERFDGLVARRQNRWPLLGFDLMAMNALAGKMIAAGFYYKTLMWPAAFWEKLYEPMIRRAAGLGKATYAPDPDAYEAMNDHCDVLVVGGGAAGLSAARAAGGAGARVILSEARACSAAACCSTRIWKAGAAT